VRGFELVAGVIVAFFAIGIGVGVLLVIALPAFRRRSDGRDIGRDGEYRRRHGQPPGHGDDGGPGWEEPPGPEDGDTRPRWPGGPPA